MNVDEILNELADRGIDVWEDGGNIHYSAEKGAMDEYIISLLKENKEKILSFLKDKREILTPDLENRFEPFPLTDLQSAYFIGRSGAYEYGNTACQVYMEFEFKDFKIEQLEFAWNKLIKRHDMLRAVFLSNGTQKILEKVPEYKIEKYDLFGLDKIREELNINTTRETMFNQVLEPDKWPLFQIKASLLDNDRAILHVVIDQLIADAYSVQILFKELFNLYSFPNMEFPPLEISFRDCVQAEANSVNSQEYKKAENYWKERVHNLADAPELPMNNNIDKDKNTSDFTRRSYHLCREKWEKFEKMALEEGLTPSTILLSAYAEVLGLWSSKSDFTLNLTIFNRQDIHPQVMDLIGDFSSTSLLEIKTSDCSSFRESAQKINKQLWDDMDHLLFSGVKVIRELSRKKEKSSNEIMPIVFTSTIGDRNFNSTDENEKGMKVAYSITKTPQVWLDNQIFEDNGEVYISWDALDEVFYPGILDEMFDSYTSFIEELIENRECWNKKNPIKAGWNRDDKGFNEIYENSISHDTLYTLFESQVENNKDKTAVVSGNRRISYDDLNDFSGCLGSLLYKNGASKNKLVGIVMEKGIEQIVAVLGVLKSGAAYLPISPDLPDERIQYLLENGDVSLVLTQSWLKDKIEWPENVKSFSVDKVMEKKAEYEDFKISYDINDTAYVIYTSGSTGLPKGVIIDHRGAVNTILDINKRFEINSSDNLFALSNLNFDLSVFDIFGTLAAGGTIVLPDSGHIKDPRHWSELIEKEGITVWNSVPALMQMLVEYNDGRHDFNLTSLRLCLLSGDWIPLELPHGIGRIAEDIDIISLGGATEASIWSVIYPVDKIESSWKSIPYGRAMNNQKIFILNEKLNECPGLVTGDIFIGGIGLSKGYWKDEDKTKSSFIFNDELGEILYKTGDKGRFLPDGNIEFLGRDDQQVKINGFRIELGEINSVFLSEPGVESAATIAVNDENGIKQIISYLVPREDSSSELFDNRVENHKSIKKIVEFFERDCGECLEKIIRYSSAHQVKIFRDYCEQKTLGIMADTILNLGLFESRGIYHNLESICEKGKIITKFRPVLKKWFDVMEKDDFLKSHSNNEYCSLPKLYEAFNLEKNNHELYRQSDNEDKIKELEKRFNLIKANLSDILTGKKDIISMLLEDDSVMGAAAFSSLNESEIYFKEFLIDLIENTVSQSIQNDEDIKIMEVGTRSAGITKDILNILPSEISYIYTDESNFFTDKLLNDNKDHANFSTGIFDMNKSFQEQGVASGEFDLILANNTLHRSKNINSTLENLKRLLNAGGVLLFLEATENSSLEFISTGLFEAGNSHYSDFRQDSGRPLISSDKWKDILFKNGFQEVYEFPFNEEYKYLGLTLFIALGPSKITYIKEEECFNFAKSKLPDYMIPRSIVYLDKLPLTENGKVDFKKLEKYKACSTYHSASKEAKPPATSTEIIIQSIWEKVLNTNIQDVNTNFFDVGGDSLLATQMVNAIREEFDIELSLLAILEEGTIDLIAKQVDVKIFENENAEEGAI